MNYVQQISHITAPHPKALNIASLHNHFCN